MTRKKTITLVNGLKLESLAEFNNGNSHIVEDDGCYALVNRDEEVDDGRFEVSPWLFPEALEVLRKLPIPPPLFTKAVQKRLAEEANKKGRTAP